MSMSKAWFCEECAHALHPECEFEQVTIGGIMGGPCVICGHSSGARFCARLAPFDFSLALRFAKRGARLTRPGWDYIMSVFKPEAALFLTPKPGIGGVRHVWMPPAYHLLAEDWELYLEETKP